MSKDDQKATHSLFGIGNICRKISNDDVYIDASTSVYKDDNRNVIGECVNIHGWLHRNKLWKDCFDALSSLCTMVKEELDIDLVMLEVRNDYPDIDGFSARFLVKD